jgi:hypothetical protein
MGNLPRPMLTGGISRARGNAACKLGKTGGYTTAFSYIFIITGNAFHFNDFSVFFMNFLKKIPI